MLVQRGKKGLVTGCMWWRRRHLRIAPTQERLIGLQILLKLHVIHGAHHMILLLRCIQQTETLLFTFLIPTAPKRPFLYRYLKTTFVLIRFIIWCFGVRNIQHTDRITNIYSFYYSLFVALHDSAAHCIQQVLVLEKALIEFQNYCDGFWLCFIVAVPCRLGVSSALFTERFIFPHCVQDLRAFPSHSHGR